MRWIPLFTLCVLIGGSSASMAGETTEEVIHTLQEKLKQHRAELGVLRNQPGWFDHCDDQQIALNDAVKMRVQFEEELIRLKSLKSMKTEDQQSAVTAKLDTLKIIVQGVKSDARSVDIDILTERIKDAEKRVRETVADLHQLGASVPESNSFWTAEAHPKRLRIEPEHMAPPKDELEARGVYHQADMLGVMVRTSAEEEAQQAIDRCYGKAVELEQVISRPMP